MCHHKKFFISKAGRGRGCPVISKKAIFITRYTSTSYNDVMKLTFGEIDNLFVGLCDLIEEEKEARKKVTEREHG